MSNGNKKQYGIKTSMSFFFMCLW